MFELVEILFKLFFVLVWLEIVLIVFFMYLLVWGICLVSRSPLPRFPRGLQRIPIRL